MKKSVSILWALTILIVLLPTSGLLQELGAGQDTIISRALAFQRSDRESSAEYVAGQLLVKFKGSPSIELLERHNLKLEERLDGLHTSSVGSQSLLSLSQTYIVTIDGDRQPKEVAAELSGEESIVYAEPNYLYQAQTVPNDPLYNAPAFQDGQWAPKRTGLEQVWGEKSHVDTVICILDSGVQLDHPDLSGNLWGNPGEVAGNGRDDDGNGFIDDVNGWNFVDNNNDVSDTYGHGTKIAGIGAVGNNGVGVAGASWGCQMMSVKVVHSDGTAAASDLVKAVNYAAATLTRQGKGGVFNCSLAGPDRSQALADAIRNSGMLFVASSGNYGTTNPGQVFYPAGLNSELPNVVSVTASTYDTDDRLLSGASWVGADLAAPGAWVMTTEMGGGYGHEGGTSLAAPYVAHALAMMLDLTNGDTISAKARVLRSVDLVPVLSGKVKTGGRLNFDKAFHARFNPNSPPTATAARSSVSAGEGQSVSLSVIASDPDGDPLTVSWDLGDGTRANGLTVTHAYLFGSYQALASVSDGIAAVSVAVSVMVTDAIKLGKIKLKGYDPAAGTANKLSVTATDSRQGQTPRPALTVVGLGDMTYDEESQAYILTKKRLNNIPTALTVRSSLGGETTQPWQ